MKDESKQPFRILRGVDESTGILDKDLTPASLKSFNEIKKFVNSFKKKKSSKKVPPKTINIEGTSIYIGKPPADIIAPAIIPIAPKKPINYAISICIIPLS